MTGEECLIQALMDYCGLSEGNARSVINSKAGKHIIQALAASKKIYAELDEVALKNLREKEQEIRDMERAYDRRRFEFDILMNNQRTEIWEEKQAHKKELERLKDLDEREKRLNELQEKLMSFESPEWRDRVRALELFDEKVGRLETAQNRTAYIASMGAIMSGVPVWSFSAKEKSTEEEPQPKASRRI